MKKHDLAGRLARRAGLSLPAAADRLDRLVHDILCSLRKGQRAPLPGLGTFLPGKTPSFQFDHKDPLNTPRGDRK